jgi:hypothetical protein
MPKRRIVNLFLPNPFPNSIFCIYRKGADYVFAKMGVFSFLLILKFVFSWWFGLIDVGDFNK